MDHVRLISPYLKFSSDARKIIHFLNASSFIKPSEYTVEAFNFNSASKLKTLVSGTKTVSIEEPEVLVPSELPGTADRIETAENCRLLPKILESWTVEPSDRTK
ncbi:hypothetical protein V5O48_006031 [Marasmius crinis-equi]|uniref:Uncharacterized protein n=1 Tax=Marasmius crinis-equi TaxID=585013 RepID=A0ABR3FKL7_9AGAR